jgi:KaiC/GvpD/RAD55 family RecA-like ATPase
MSDMKSSINRIAEKPPHQPCAVVQAIHLMTFNTAADSSQAIPASTIAEPLRIQSVRSRIANYVEEGVQSIDVLEALYNGSTFLPAEGYLFDYKQSWPESRSELSKYARHVAAFHNVFGGYIIFGVAEIEKDTVFKPCENQEPTIDVKQFGDILREYLSTPIEVTIRTYSIKCDLGIEKFITLMHVPKRASGIEPNVARKTLKNDKDKALITSGEIYIRDGDNSIPAQFQQHWKTVYGYRINPYLGNQDNGLNERILESNLPDRSLIYGEFVGRTDELEKLWGWLGDDFSRVRVLAGEGGHGKTSIAYEFASDFCRAVPAGFERVIWLTAKKQQFRALENSFEVLGLEVFQTPSELMQQMGIAMAPASEEELVSCPEDRLPRLVKQLSTNIAALVIIDDLDSLELDEQKRCIEICQQFSTTKSRFLFTTRKNVTASSASSIEVNGFGLEEFKKFLDAWTKRLGLISFKNPDVKALLSTTGGSPLFTESILRLLKQGVSVTESLKLWKGHLGIEVRNAALQREVRQLSMESRKILAVVAAVGECSFAEIKTFSGFTEQTVLDAANELQSLFLLSAPPIAKERRFAVSSTTRQLVKSLGPELVPDYEAYVRDVFEKKYKASGEGRRTSLIVVARAIDQAMAQISEGRPEDALRTVEEVNGRLGGKNADLLSVKARALAEVENQTPMSIRKAFEAAYAAGQRKEVFFDCWYRSEFKASNWDGAIQVIDYAVGDKDIEMLGFWVLKRVIARLEAANRHRTSDPEHAVNQVKAAVQDFRVLTKCFGLNTGVDQMKIRRLTERFADLHWDIPRSSGDFTGWIDGVERQLEFVALGDTRYESYIRAAVAFVGLRSAGAPKGITSAKLRELLQAFETAPLWIKTFPQFITAHSELKQISLN